MFRNREGRVFERTLFPLWLRAGLFSAGFFLCAWVGSFLSVRDWISASYWLPAGLFISVLLLHPTRDWLWLTLAAFPASLAFCCLHNFVSIPSLTIILYLSIVFHSVLGAWLVRRFVTEFPALTTLKEFFGLIGLAGISSAMVGATVGTTTLTVYGFSQQFLHTWFVWWIGSTMAILIIGPLLLTWPRPGQGQTKRMSTLKRLEAAGLFSGLSFFTWYLLVLGGGINSPKVPLLIFILWAGLRFGVRGAALMVFWLALWVGFLTTYFLKGLSPADIASGNYIVTLQIYLAVAAGVGLIPAIVLRERDRMTSDLRESEQSLRATIENTPYVSVQWYDPRGRVVYWNRASEIIFGWPAADALGKTLDQLMFTAEQAAAFQQTIAQIEQNGRPVGPVEFPFCRRDGKSGVILSTIFQIQLASGEPRIVCMDVDLTQRKQSEALTHTQSQVLEMIATGRPLKETLEALIRLLEAQLPEMLGSILLLDADGIHVRHGAGRSLPAEFNQAINGLPIGPVAGSCGTAAYRREPVFVADIANDPLWADYKNAALPHGLRACWSTPILDAQKQVLGTFAIYYRQVGLPDESHRQLIDMATHTAAICIGKHRSEIEQARLVEREQQSRSEYTRQLISAQEAERKRIAGELHDSLGQNLLLIKNLAQMASASQQPAQVYEQVIAINNLATQCIAEVRQIARELHPHQLDHLGLKRVLELMLEQAAHASPIRFSWKLDDPAEILSAESKMNLYRIVQESLNNVLKHSGARNVLVRLECDLHEVVLEITDDGSGFVPPSAAGQQGMGLKNIAERVRMLGGKLKIEAAPGTGTRIEVRMPLMAEGEAFAQVL